MNIRYHGPTEDEDHQRAIEDLAERAENREAQRLGSNATPLLSQKPNSERPAGPKLPPFLAISRKT